MSLRANLPATLLRRLVVSGVSSRSLSASSSRVLAQQIRKSSNNGGFTQQLLKWNLERSSFYGASSIQQQQQITNFHSSSVRSRQEARIDESLNRLDVEIRRIGRIKRQEVDDILEDIKEMKKATSSQSLMIIRCCGELIPEESPSRRTELVSQVWSTLESLNVAMDVSHYNALLRVYLENEHKFNPTEFLQDLTNKGIEPNRVTYQRLIARYCQEGDIDGASTILQHMKEKQMPINEYVFNALILGHGQANDMESAEGILSVMKQAGLEPNDDTHVTLMTCYAKHGDINNIHRIAKECEEKEVFLIDRDFLNTIVALSESNNDNLIDEILPYLKRHSGFNHEATNVIFRLVNLGHEESAYKILKQMVPISRQGTPVESGNFLIKHLVHLSRPSEMIVKYCKSLQSDGLNNHALLRACEFALVAQKYDLALELLAALNEEGVTMRQHYFWPFIASAKSEKEVYKVIARMRDFGLSPNVETLRDYVIPKVLNIKRADESLENSLQRISSAAGVSLDSIASAAMLHLLHSGEMKLAVNFASMYRVPFGSSMLRRAIIEAYLRTKDASTFVKIIGSASLDGEENSRECVGMMLMELMNSMHSIGDKAALLHPVLKELLAHGLGLSNSGSELLQNSLGEALTPDLANTIIQLTSSELTPKISIEDQGRRIGAGGPAGGLFEDKTTAELQHMLADAVRRNAPRRGIKKALIYSYCRDRNVEETDKLKAELSGEGFVFTPGMRAMFLDLYSQTGDIEKAKKEYDELKDMLGVNFIMDDVKILHYAQLLQSKGDLEGCFEVLKNTPRDDTRKLQGAAQQATCWKLLNSVAESNPEKVKDLFNLLQERGLVTANNVILGPLIKAHLINDNVTGALEEFERCVREHKATPWKRELFCRFIKSEDADNLQKVMDLSTSIYGEVNSMYDLVFAFIDCGKLRQAKKILETPGLRARNDKFEFNCQRYFQENRVGELENLIQVTKDLMDVDRSSMYFYLLQTYCKMGDADKALSVWTNMQEENVQPSVELLIYLADFLRKNNRPIPFVVPDDSEVAKLPSSSSESEPTRAILPKSVTEFRKYLDINDIDKALQMKQRMDAEGSSLTLQDLSILVEKLTRAERLNEATRLTDELLDRGLYPYLRHLRFLLTRLSVAGDVSALEKIHDKLPVRERAAVMFNSKLCLGYVNANRGEEFFHNKIKKIVESNESSDSSSSESSSDEAGEQEEFGERVPVFATIKLVSRNEQLLPELTNMASNAAGAHQKALYNVLWGVYMNKREFAKANGIWETKLKTAERVLFRSAVAEARDRNDVEIAIEAANHIVTSTTLPPAAKALPYAIGIDILVNQARLSEAHELLDKSLSKVSLEDYPIPVLLRLKETSESANIPFKHIIPERKLGSRKEEQSLDDE